jgi:hypothetical protein
MPDASFAHLRVVAISRPASLILEMKLAPKEGIA